MAKKKVIKKTKKRVPKKRVGKRGPVRDISWQPVFLDYYQKRYSIRSAARLAGVSPTTVRTARKTDPGFARRFDTAHDNVVDKLENSAMRRAIHGYNSPVFHRGVLVGHKRSYSDALTIFMLKKNRPDKYDDQFGGQLEPEEYAERLRAVMSAANDLVPKGPKK
jgi:hypothetical protein